MINSNKSIKYFSSSFNKETLLASGRDGSIFLDNKFILKQSNIQNNLQSNFSSAFSDGSVVENYVRFYPKDNYIFSTTGLSGLSVFDTFKQNEIYKYRNEYLKSHSYSYNCILGSFDDYNIKFYDLRSRYMNGSLNYNNILKLDFIGNDIVFLNEDNILTLLDCRNNQVIKQIINVKDFTISNFYNKEDSKTNLSINDLYYLSLKDNLLFSYNLLNGNNISKKCQFNSIHGINNYKHYNGVYGSIITESGNSIIKIEESSNIWTIENIKGKVQKIHFGKKKTFIFVEEELIVLDDNYDQLARNYLISNQQI